MLCPFIVAAAGCVDVQNILRVFCDFPQQLNLEIYSEDTVDIRRCKDTRKEL
jgi:hypothetical protein